MTDVARPPKPPKASSPPNPGRRKRGSKAPPRARPKTPAQAGAARLLTPHRVRALLWGLGALLGTLAIAAGFLLIGYGRTKTPGTGTVELDWPADLGAEDAAALLAARGLVESREGMAMFLRASGGTADFVAGPHLLVAGSTPWELRRMLSRSLLRSSAKLVIPEGFNRFDIGARLEKQRLCGKRSFVAAGADKVLLAELGIAPPAESVEGYLFPATYEFPLDTDPRDVIRRLVAESNKRWDALAGAHKESLTRLKASLGWGRREILTLASIIEKEAAVDDERPLIASVFFNRLVEPDFKSHKLQSDPTSAYGCVAFPDEAPSCAEFAGKPTPATNRDPKNRYSTYTHAGLTPGPISNPGTRSLDAALSPDKTRFFYFVASGGGRHTFSETFEGHNDAINRGRSP